MVTKRINRHLYKEGISADKYYLNVNLHGQLTSKIESFSFAYRNNLYNKLKQFIFPKSLILSQPKHSNRFVAAIL